jgi:hypothetical protein
VKSCWYYFQGNIESFRSCHFGFKNWLVYAVTLNPMSSSCVSSTHAWKQYSKVELQIFDPILLQQMMKNRVSGLALWLKGSEYRSQWHVSLCVVMALAMVSSSCCCSPGAMSSSISPLYPPSNTGSNSSQSCTCFTCRAEANVKLDCKEQIPALHLIHRVPWISPWRMKKVVASYTLNFPTRSSICQLLIKVSNKLFISIPCVRKLISNFEASRLCRLE